MSPAAVAWTGAEQTWWTRGQMNARGQYGGAQSVCSASAPPPPPHTHTHHLPPPHTHHLPPTHTHPLAPPLLSHPARTRPLLLMPFVMFTPVLINFSSVQFGSVHLRSGYGAMGLYHTPIIAFRHLRGRRMPVKQLVSWCFEPSQLVKQCLEFGGYKYVYEE